MKEIIGSIVLLYGIASVVAIPRAFSATTQPTVTQNITVPPHLSNEQSMSAGASKNPTFEYEWFPYRDLPMSLLTLQTDFRYVLNNLQSHPYEKRIPRRGLIIEIPQSGDLWAIQGPFPYETAAWYARAMWMYFEQPQNPHCALVLSIWQRVSGTRAEVGRVEMRPRPSPGQGGRNLTASETVETVDTTKKY